MMTVRVITPELFYTQYPCAAGQHFGDGFHFDIAQTARIQEGCPALVGREQAFQRAGSKTGQHEDGLPPGIL
nr:hypothetical protein [Escherichia coli]